MTHGPFKSVLVAMDNMHDEEAIYVDGKLVYSDPTVDGCDIEMACKGSPCILKTLSVDPVDEWPQDVSDFGFNALGDQSSLVDPEQREASPEDLLKAAVAAYLSACETFKLASSQFNEACSELKGRLGYGASGKRFLLLIDGRYQLVTTDKDGNFDIEEMALM
jgi:hypothetical protein